MALSLGSIPSRAAVVTPSDTIGASGGALYVGGAGNVSLLTGGGDTVVFIGVVPGTILPIQFLRVNAATTATNLIRLW